MLKKIITTLILIIIWSVYIEPNMLIINRYYIKDNDLRGLKIVFAGDFHIKKNQRKRLERIITLINKENPDIVLSAGDFVSGRIKSTTLPLEEIAGNLRKIEKPIYTVLGNHDIWIYKNEAAAILSRNGINVLLNNNMPVKIKDKEIYIAGVEDLTTGEPNIYKALLNINTQKPIILLTHSPDMFTDVPNNVNLTLAGHVHGGQVRIPFIGALIVPSMYGNRYSQGLIEENGRKMLVTKGIGTSILPIRFNCIPEITVINFL